MSRASKINPLPFYNNWSGHPLPNLATFHSLTQSTRPGKPIVYLAGDSSLDNKAWVPSSDPLPVKVPEIYNTVLAIPTPKPDVAFWLNHFLGDRTTVINTAVEATMLRSRDEQLLEHDEFIREHIRPEDILIVSIGANDIALSPTASTMRHMGQLAWLTSRSSIESGTASSLAYFKHMFGAQTQSYISRLVSKTKPAAVIVCMIYFPLEAMPNMPTSWADPQLKMLGYNQDPGQLQAAIRQMYAQATREIEVEGTRVVACPLFEVLDGKDADDYTARVEPSLQGGRKMAERFGEIIMSLV